MAYPLRRMFHLAKAIGAEAKENFTTEALAAAIRSEPKPFLAALRDSRAIDPDWHGDNNGRVRTQVRVKGAGQIDLVLYVGGREVWVEVKVDAGESGDQLGRYSAFILRQAIEHRPALVVVGPRRLGEYAWLSWQQIRTAICEAETPSPYWLDLKTYLEEIGMADSYDETVTQSEAAALRAARGLLGKVARILTPFAASATRTWPDSTWPSNEAKVIDAITRTFVSHGSMAISNANKYRASVSAGARLDPDSDDPRLGLWIWSRPTRVVERGRILEIANSRCEDDWRIDAGEWALVGTYVPLASFKSGSDATQWLAAKLTKLSEAGLLELLPRLGMDDARDSTDP